MASRVRMSWDNNAFKKLAEQGVRDLVANLQPVLDAIRSELSGQPVDVIKPRLASAWQDSAGHPLTDPHLSEWASAISNGDRVVLQAGGLR